MMRERWMLRGWVSGAVALLGVSSVQCNQSQTCAEECAASRWYAGIEKCDDEYEKCKDRRAGGCDQVREVCMASLGANAPCYEACINACRCGFLPSPLGRDGEHFMDVCLQSAEQTRALVTECLGAEDDGAPWCQAAEEASVSTALGSMCADIETCLLREFEPSVVGRAQAHISFYRHGESAAGEPRAACRPSDARFDDRECLECEDSWHCDELPRDCEVHARDAETLVAVDPCGVLQVAGAQGQDLQIQFLQVFAERDQWVFPLVDVECGEAGTLDTSSFVKTVPAGNLRYVAKLRGTFENGDAVCWTARSPEIVSKADRELHVTMLLSDPVGWGCEDDLFHCADGIDNDGDDELDCVDDDCSGFCGEFGVDACGDGVDNDDDGTVDCEDYGCGDVGALCESGVVTCGDGVDNDGDGLVDCAEPETCATYCGRGADCRDGIDNDGDGLVDCEEPSCRSECT